METKCYSISYVAIRISTPPINATSTMLNYIFIALHIAMVLVLAIYLHI